MLTDIFKSIIKTEVLCTYDMSDFIEIENLLNSNNIPFKRKFVNHNFHGLNTRQNIIGTVGQRLEFETQYYLYVSYKFKNDAEYLIREWRRNKSIY